MYLEKRPTAVSVIGWAWVVIGSLMLLSGVMGFVMGLVSGDTLSSDPGVPFVFRYFTIIAALQVPLAVFAIVSGVHFLRMRAWSRLAIEVLTWLALAYVVGMFVFMAVFTLGAFRLGGGPGGFDILFIGMAGVISALYGAPLVIMLRSLRGARMREMFSGPAQQRYRADGQAVD